MNQATLLPPECNPINNPLASKIHDAVTLAIQECVRQWAIHTDAVINQSFKIVDLDSPIKKTAAAVNAVFGMVDSVLDLAGGAKVGGGMVGVGLKTLEILGAAEEKEYDKLKLVVNGKLDEAIRNISTFVHKTPVYYFDNNPRAQLERYFLVDIYKDIYANTYNNYSLYSLRDEIFKNFDRSKTYLVDRKEIFNFVSGNLKAIGDKINRFMSGFRTASDAALDELPPLNFIAGNPFDSISVDNTIDGKNNPKSIQVMGITDMKKAAEVLANIWNYDIVDNGFLANKIVATKKSNQSLTSNIPGASRTVYPFLIWLQKNGAMSVTDLAKKNLYYQSLEAKQDDILSHSKLVCRLQAQPDTIKIMRSKP